ncbi:YhcN/YlaJ family sporulation lipoprotein [Pseudalkalibacillus decolorationis]|uniref:YhcN/YlaJ family sporulation lipoprotein n=1 Tax=Pseudalkalibacillus decolorationis TaxID=163879 RepID=UPI0021481A98|nr:YhcN/YlaJ family sporulation lipoprotein [Pseudalkalibacillus decolorationis]
MKELFMTVFLFSILGLTGCGMTNDEYEGANGNGVNPTKTNELENQAGTRGEGQAERMDDYGYTRIQSPLGNGSRIFGDSPKIDKKQLSTIISRLVMQMEEVNDAATLVTSEEVLIVYDTDAENRNQMADKVKRSAISVVPRYYHVYVSDDTTLFESIERYKNLDDNTENVESSLNALIKEMKKSPQGKRMSEGEDENGVHDGEMNDNKNNDQAK